MCTNPVKLRTGILVGCGHCQQCLKAYQDQWIARLSEELKQWNQVGLYKPVIFFTLKYRNDSVPCTYLNIYEKGYALSDSRPDCTDNVYPFWTELSELNKGNWKIRKERMLSIAREFREFQGECYHPYITEGKPVASFEFHSVRKKDVQDWLKRGRINLQRKYPSIFNLVIGQNPRQKTHWRDSEGNLQEYPSCSLTPTVKYFITSEYGPRTFRPHYHGVMFGVTFNEFKKCFAEDWQKHFGSIDFQILDPSRGGIAYVGKYCSKGMYEHPYCSRDFFYPSGLEYHSKDYEYSIKDFGVNAPLVSRTFHLISKGLGVGYCFNSEIQDFFGARLEAVTSPSGKLSYIVSDKCPDKVDYIPITGLFDKAYGPSCSLDIVPNDLLGVFYLKKYEVKHNRETGVTSRKLIGESTLSMDAVVNSGLEQRLLNKKYSRTYVKKENKAPQVHGAWHLVGHGVTELSTKTTSIAVPRYYRRWLLSPLASSLRASAAYLLYPSLDEQTARIIQQHGLSDETLAACQSLVDSEMERREDTTRRLRKSAEHFYYNRAIIEGIS